MTEERPTPGTVTRNDVDANAGRAQQRRSRLDLAPVRPVGARGGGPFGSDEWAPASSVRRPWVRVGRWTLLYRRAA